MNRYCILCGTTSQQELELRMSIELCKGEVNIKQRNLIWSELYVSILIARSEKAGKFLIHLACSGVTAIRVVAHRSQSQQNVHAVPRAHLYALEKHVI